MEQTVDAKWDKFEMERDTEEQKSARMEVKRGVDYWTGG